MGKIGNLIICLLFLIIIFGVAIMSFLRPDRDISTIENRTLTQRPPFDIATILSGEFFQNFDKYFTDQIVGRDRAVKVYTQEQLLLNKTVINNNVRADDNWLLFSPMDVTIYPEIDESAKKLSEFTKGLEDQDIEFYFAPSPYKMNILKDKYPKYLNDHLGIENLQYFIDKLPEEIYHIDLYTYLTKNYSKEDLEEMYFKTDHHWNIKGAVAAFQKTIETIYEHSYNVKDSPFIDSYEAVCNNNATFLGSINLQLHMLVNAMDEYICHYSPMFNPETIAVQAMQWDGTILTDINQIYGTGFNKKEIMYGDLFTWDLPEIIFENKTPPNDTHILVLKDSYGNPIQPFFAPYFKKTSILDIRHYKDKSVYQYVKDNDVDIVLFLYNDSNLTGEMYNLK